MKFIFNFTFINVLKDGTDKLASHLPANRKLEHSLINRLHELRQYNKSNNKSPENLSTESQVAANSLHAYQLKSKITNIRSLLKLKDEHHKKDERNRKE